MFFHAPSTRNVQEDEALFIMQGNTFPHQPPSFPSQIDIFLLCSPSIRSQSYPTPKGFLCGIK